LNFILIKEDFEITKFIIIDELDFNGNFEFLEKLVNLEYLCINGINGICKTNNLTEKTFIFLVVLKNKKYHPV
jgi:hypothetical protein